MQPSYVLGIDIGTGSVKAVALDRGGQVLCSAQQFYPGAGKTEQELEPIWQAFQTTVSNLTRDMQAPPVAVGLSSAMHSIMAVDNVGQPITSAVLWSDTRSTAIAQALRGTKLGEQLYLATGTPIHSMSPLCKIRWWQQNSPGMVTEAHKFISIKEAIWHRLFGEFVVDYSIASATGLFNHHHLQWDKEALRFAGITPLQLSTPVAVAHSKTLPAGTHASELNLPAGIPFFVGASDGCLANLGSGCFTPEEAAVTIGTSAAVRITTASPVQKPEQMIFHYLLEADRYVCGGAINNGGNIFQWLLKNLFAGHKDVRSFDDLLRIIETVPAGSDGLLFLPYLHGERAPIWDEQSSGVYFGLTARHNIHHMARAAAEGVCFALTQLLDVLQAANGSIQRLKVSGGLVQSPVVMQLLADVTRKDVVVQQVEDASAVGAALLSQKAMGWFPDYTALPQKQGRTFTPDASTAAIYQDLFSLYQRLYPLLKDPMHAVSFFQT